MRAVWHRSCIRQRISSDGHPDLPRWVREFTTTPSVRLVLNVEHVDPRDATWEVDASVYRVHFWQSDVGYASDEYRLTGADVLEVLEWAQSTVKPEQTFTIYAELDRHGLGLIRLAGDDPTES